MPPTTQPEHVVTQVSVVVLQTWVAPHVVAPAAQLSAASLQTSTPLHMTRSEHTRGAPEQERAAHTSLSVQKRPSSQRAPLFALHTVGAVRLQTSHGFIGLT